jgi:hypothetical protein
MRRKRLGDSMRLLKRGWFVPITAAAVIATACGGGGEPDIVQPQVPVDAKPINYVGRDAKACGTVVATDTELEHPNSVNPTATTISFLTFDRTQVTFLDFETEDPDFLVFFWGKTKRQAGYNPAWPDIADPSIDLAGGWFDGKKICVSGRIRRYRDKAAILINDWRQIDFLEE